MISDDEDGYSISSEECDYSDAEEEIIKNDLYYEELTTMEEDRIDKIFDSPISKKLTVEDSLWIANKNNNVSLNLGKESFCITSKRNPLSLKSKLDQTFEQKQNDSLSNENILHVATYNCCYENCIRKISCRSDCGDYSEICSLVKGCREELLGLQDNKKYDIIRNIIAGNNFSLYKNNNNELNLLMMFI